MSYTMIQVGNIFFEFINIMIIANVVLGFMVPNKSNKVISLVYGMTEPILEPVRKIATFKTMDFAPFVVILLIDYVVIPVYIHTIALFF